jgi:Outer membrane protein beta-barrel domain
MQKWLIAFFLLFSAVSLTAQTGTTADVDTSATSISFEDEDPSRDRFLLSFHWDGWMGAPDSMKVKGLSSGIGIHTMYDIPLGSDNVSFAIGAGLSWSNYYNNVFFTGDSITTVTPIVDSVIAYNKNKFVINYVEVPVEFRFRTDEKNGNRFKAAVGFKAGYMLSNHTKYVGDDYISGTGDEIKYKQYRIRNTSTLQYGPTLRLGYNKVNIQAYYGLASIFTEGDGPTGNPLTIGISFNPF